ncbi:MAG: SMC-Scp complex subunit ScpB [Candidatus Micrarchaeota archaeon]|nr:SMC-Scp complex subunit ScpB [Candidatus Micrarchaeota archaeon]
MASLSTREIIESILFAVPDAYTADELSLKINRKREDVEKALQEMATDYRSRNGVIAIEEVNGRFAMVLRRDIAPQLKRFIREAELTPFELKVLAIISKHSGIMKSQMAKAMGSGVYDHIRSLVDKGFVQESRIGRSTSLRTTGKVPDIDKIVAAQAAAQQIKVQSIPDFSKPAENAEPPKQDPPLPQ